MKRLTAILFFMSVITAVAAEPIVNTDTTTGVVVGGNGEMMFATGGIGQDQQEAMRKIGGDCNVRLTFAQAASGEYLADVNLKIRNSIGQEVFDVVSAGPFFYTKLPQGKYVITAEWHGNQQQKEIVILNTGTKNLYLYWSK